MERGSSAALPCPRAEQVTETDFMSVGHRSLGLVSVGGTGMAIIERYHVTDISLRDMM